MKLERLTNNKIKIFLTFDDLIDRGLTKEDVHGNSLKVHKLFQEMIEEACEELSFKMSGAIAIEIFSLQAQGLIIIVTKDEEEIADDDEDDEFLDLQVKVGEHPDILYTFSDLEDVIQLCYALKSIEIESSSLYRYENHYYFLINRVQESRYDAVISLAAEYGSVSTLTLFRVQEYGKLIITDEAVSVLTSHFLK
ncbi:genetic competence negative regulator [Peribacillus cavernae]|uniref:Genetic competence negative regulator n=1 Tax=Peribacillus cavernae TaxID=1674310 RepID=A0A433HLM9_9BACI|nr:genetic competence negative regulator [Peribacillus cavernae]MDQ0219017.1 adapter protein MecA 1/2 [Peribacillus cavernae]RUQ29277.1 genetic competence negative regulator [Peribacillus cavernae]